MTHSDLILHYKTVGAAAKAIGYDRQRIHAYRESPIPLSVQVEFEIESDGALKADLPGCIRDGDYTGEKRRRLREQTRALG